jgi:hypothetical protein
MTSATPKAANGATSTPKSVNTAEPKGAKPKSKKAVESEEKVEKEASAVKARELSSADKYARKKVRLLQLWSLYPWVFADTVGLQKEVLFLRHKLQKGLLTRDQEPKEAEMKQMSEYVTTLEAFPNLEVSIIRETKINKVLKAILKLENIPKEDEFKFKPRSQVLLDKWNKLLAVEAPEVNGTSKESEKANGVKEKDETDEPSKDKGEVKANQKGQKEEAKEESKEVSNGGSKEASKPSEASEPSGKPAAEEVSL